MVKKNVKKESKNFNKRYLAYGLGGLVLVILAVLIFVNYSASTGEAVRKTSGGMLPAYDENRVQSATLSEKLSTRLIGSDKLIYTKTVTDLSKYPLVKDAIKQDYCLCPVCDSPNGNGGGSTGGSDNGLLCFENDGGNNAGQGSEIVGIKYNNIVKRNMDTCTPNPTGGAKYTEYYCENGEIKSQSGKCQETGFGDQCNKNNTACVPECVINNDCKRDGFAHYSGDSCIKQKCVQIYKDLTCKGDTTFTPGLIGPSNNGIIKDLAKQSKTYLVYGSELTKEDFLNLDLPPYYLTLSTKGYPFTDYCKSSTEVVKYVCGNDWGIGYMTAESYTIPPGFKDFDTLIVPKTYNCPTGTSCSNGACIMSVSIIQDIPTPVMPK